MMVLDFEDEVRAVLGDGMADDETGDSSLGDLYVAVGTLPDGTPFGFEENHFGQSCAHFFATISERDDWFREVSAAVGPSGV